MTDQLLVVQFPHPGHEHGSDWDNVKEWNVGRHARKFMEVSGRWRETSDLSRPESARAASSSGVRGTAIVRKIVLRGESMRKLCAKRRT